MMLSKHWHRQFKCGRNFEEKVPIPGRQQSAIDNATIQQVQAAILDDRLITVRQLVHEVKISVGSMENIIHDHSHMGKVSARWIHGYLLLSRNKNKSSSTKEVSNTA